MTRRDFRTPSTLPTSTLTRCVTVPASQEWLGLVNAALLMLTEPWRYTQVFETDMSPAETAARAFEMYVAYLEGCDMDCSNVLACMLPYMQAQQIAGGTVRLDPVTDVPQVSYDGGTTWTDIPESGQPVQTPTPTVTPGNDDAERICLAATRAALVIAQFYEQTFGAFTADLLNTLNSINQFLHSINTALYNLVYSPYEGVLEAAGWFDFDFTTNYTAGTLTTEQVEDIICLLVDNASVAGGIVEFDQAAVQAGLIAALGVNPGTAVTLLVSTMRSEGLQSASLVNVVSSADCTHCDPPGACVSLSWQFPTGPGAQWSFTDGSWPLNASGWDARGQGQYVPTPPENEPGVLTTQPGGTNPYRFDLVIDLGTDCTVLQTTVQRRSYTTVTTADYRIEYLDAAKSTLFSSARFSVNSLTWTTITEFTDVVGVRYVRVNYVGATAAATRSVTITVDET